MYWGLWKKYLFSGETIEKLDLNSLRNMKNGQVKTESRYFGEINPIFLETFPTSKHGNGSVMNWGHFHDDDVFHFIHIDDIIS